MVLFHVSYLSHVCTYQYLTSLGSLKHKTMQACKESKGEPQVRENKGGTGRTGVPNVEAWPGASKRVFLNHKRYAAVVLSAPETFPIYFRSHPAAMHIDSIRLDPRISPVRRNPQPRDTTGVPGWS